MRLVRCSTLLSLFVALSLVSSVLRAQTAQPISDYLEVTVTDQNGVNIIAPARYLIPEPTPTADPGEQPVTIEIPGLDVNFVEEVGPAVLISDRFHLNPYAVVVDSRDQAPRTNAKRIPPAALENFFPMQITAFSDGEASTGNISDSVRIRYGLWNAATGPGDLVFEGNVGEPDHETGTEPRINWEVPGVNFDVAEPLFEDPTEHLISDYVNLSSIHGFFLSSGNTADYANLPVTNITLVENPALGGLLTYSLRFVSDVVPEPSACGLLGAGLLMFGLAGARRRR